MFNQVQRIVIWLCSKFKREEIEIIINELTDILKNRNPEIKIKDEFKEQHPNYRDYSVDDQLPLSEPIIKKKL